MTFAHITYLPLLRFLSALQICDTKDIIYDIEFDMEMQQEYAQSMWEEDFARRQREEYGEY